MEGDDMKYIIFKINGGEVPIIFPIEIQHSTMKRKMHAEPVSAGFVSYRLNCYGDSFSLGLDSRPEKDSEIIKKYFGIDPRYKMHVEFSKP